jgi:hypothetical protein
VEDAGELGGGVAGEIDDGGEAGGERRAGVQHGAERIGLAGQDDGELVAVEFTRFGQELAQAAEQVLAVIRQGVPGIRAGDHHQVTGDPDRLAARPADRTGAGPPGPASPSNLEQSSSSPGAMLRSRQAVTGIAMQGLRGTRRSPSGEGQRTTTLGVRVIASRSPAAAQVRRAEALAQAAEAGLDARLLQLRTPAPGQAAYLTNQTINAFNAPVEAAWRELDQAEQAAAAVPAGSGSATWPRT